jgi:hypothetical protein
MKMKENIKASARTTAFAILLSVAAFIIFAIELAIFPGLDSNTVSMNPFISGFMHATISHIGLNSFVLFFVLLSPVNSGYDIKKIVIVTTIISLIYLPVSVLGITKAAVGLSGTCYFLLSRYFFSWKRYRIIGYAIILFLAFAEGLALPTGDGEAHGVHLIGIALGFITLHLQVPAIGPNKKVSPFDETYSI